MPAKSKAQFRFLFAKERAGQLRPGTAREFAEGVDYQKLPDRVGSSKEASGVFLVGLSRLSGSRSKGASQVPQRWLPGGPASPTIASHIRLPPPRPLVTPPPAAGSPPSGPVVPASPTGSILEHIANPTSPAAMWHRAVESHFQQPKQPAPPPKLAWLQPFVCRLKTGAACGNKYQTIQKIFFFTPDLHTTGAAKKASLRPFVNLFEAESRSCRAKSSRLLLSAANVEIQGKEASFPPAMSTQPQDQQQLSPFQQWQMTRSPQAVMARRMAQYAQANQVFQNQVNQYRANPWGQMQQPMGMNPWGYPPQPMQQMYPQPQAPQYPVAQGMASSSRSFTSKPDRPEVSWNQHVVNFAQQAIQPFSQMASQTAPQAATTTSTTGTTSSASGKPPASQGAQQTPSQPLTAPAHAPMVSQEQDPASLPPPTKSPYQFGRMANAPTTSAPIQAAPQAAPSAPTAPRPASPIGNMVRHVQQGGRHYLMPSSYGSPQTSRSPSVRPLPAIPGSAS